MAEPSTPDHQHSASPSRRDRMRPLELVGFAGVLAVFAGLVVIFTTRDIVLAGIFTGVAFIVTLVMVALIGLGKKPSDDDVEARKDLQQPDDKDSNWH